MASLTYSEPRVREISVHRYEHTSLGGFCSVCGTVFPCARAGTETAPVLVPVAR
jgi:hypothetical protein